MFNKSRGSARVMRQGAKKASVEQYKDKYQKNIGIGSKGRMCSEIGGVSEINKYVAKYEK